MRKRISREPAPQAPPSGLRRRRPNARRRAVAALHSKPAPGPVIFRKLPQIRPAQRTGKAPRAVPLDTPPTFQDGINANQAIIGNCLADSNTGHGITVISGSLIRHNLSRRNGQGATGSGAGIHAAGSDNRIEANHCTDNDWGLQIAIAGNIILGNSCSGNTTRNWEIAANNVFGGIADRTAPASPLVNGNSAASSLGTTEPGANFTH